MAGEPLAAGVPPERVAELYARWAPFYDLWAGLEAASRRRVLSLARLRDGEAVLELAVGTGLLFENVLRSNPTGRNVGVDLTEAMLQRARRRAERTGAPFELELADARRLRFEPAAFDAVLCTYLFDLLPEPDFPAVLGEALRVLRPGGRLVVANMMEPGGLLGAAYRRAYRFAPSLLGGCRGIELLGHVRAAGFVEARQEIVSQLGFRSEVVRAERAC